MTAGKRDLIIQSMLPLDSFIYEAVEASEYPCKWDLLTAESLIKPLMEVNVRATPKEVGNAFGRLGYTQLGRHRMLGDDDKIRLWAVRNFSTYREMETSQLRQIWTAQINGANGATASDVDAVYENRPRNGGLNGSKPM